MGKTCNFLNFLIFLSIVINFFSCSKKVHKNTQISKNTKAEIQPLVKIKETRKNYFIAGPLWMSIEALNKDDAQKIKPLAILSGLSPEIAKSNPITGIYSTLNNESITFDQALGKLEHPDLIFKAWINPKKPLDDEQLKKVQLFKNITELTINIDTFQKIKDSLEQFKQLDKLTIIGNAKTELVLTKNDTTLLQNLSQLSFEFIPQLSFPAKTEFPNLTSLSFFGSNIKSQNWVILENFNNVEKLNLRFTTIKEKDLPCLTSFANLKLLDLSSNKITTNGFYSLPVLSKLETLNIETGTIFESMIAPEKKTKTTSLLNFKNYPSLVHLNTFGRTLHKHHLKGIGACKNLEVLKTYNISTTPVIMDDLTQLTKLRSASKFSISGFPLSKPHKTFLKHLKEIDQISFSNTNFTDLDWEEFKALKKIKDLHISNCPITKIPDLSDYKNLNTLSIKDCVFVDSVSVSHQSLEFFYFKNNQLSSLNLDTPGLKSLPKFPNDLPVKLKSNLKHIDSISFMEKTFSKNEQDIISKLPNLKTIDFYRCKFDIMPDFTSSSKLKSISFIGENKPLPAGIFTAIKKIENIEQLAFTSCEINDRYMKFFSQFQTLKSLNLGWNNIQGKNMHFLAKLENLEELTLSLNRKVEWERSIDLLCKSTKLHTINLEGTPITKIGYNKLLKLQQLQTITISEKFQKFIPKDKINRFKFSIF